MRHSAPGTEIKMSVTNNLPRNFAFKLSSYFIMDGYSVFIVLTEQAVSLMCG